ncbi:uncharacterized protein V1510DRAFT_306418 [Dipodascopsis tothii]|uniref:uncharacterized protein n=1 Tax=Dipodascopsis tothii TaxID=44089 RepID=UPI0034CEB821
MGGFTRRLFKSQRGSRYESDSPLPPNIVAPDSHRNSTATISAPELPKGRAYGPTPVGGRPATSAGVKPVNSLGRASLAPTVGENQDMSVTGPVEIESSAVEMKNELIVGIDFGTTFTGVSFAWAVGNDVKKDYITEWPGVGNVTQTKIPSVIYYDQHNQVVGWGQDTENALTISGYPKPGVIRVEWFKLYLQRNYKVYADLSTKRVLPPGKSEIDVTADFLGEVRKAMRVELEKKLGGIFRREEENIRYFLTVPAIWTDAGKNATRRAAVQAGFIKDINDRRLTLITEPEAAAIFCAREDANKVHAGEAFLVVDCGGGTVDLIAYEVEDEDPFTVRECTTGTGELCGSVAIDMSFWTILKTKMNNIPFPADSEIAARTRHKIQRRCQQEFASVIKPKFKNRGEGEDIFIDVGLGEDVSYPEADIEDGYMKFTNAEILSAFTNVVTTIVQLVRDQIAAVEAQNKPLRSIYVVGGFGGSAYLYERLKYHIPPQYKDCIYRPMDSVAAIMRGAVLTGLSDRFLVSRVSRRHYMMGTLEPFRPGVHPEEFKYKGLDGSYKCKYTRQILVHKGQRLHVGETSSIKCYRTARVNGPLIFEDRLYCCDEDECPPYTKDPAIREFVVLTSDLSKIPKSTFSQVKDANGEAYYKIYFQIRLTLDGGNELRAELVCNDEVQGHVRSRFK